MFFESFPSITLTKITTPRYVSYQLSTNKHFKSAELSPVGLGNVVIICSKISSIPSPVLPEQEIALFVSIPTTSSISFLFFQYLKRVNQSYLILESLRDLFPKPDKH